MSQEPNAPNGCYFLPTELTLQIFAECCSELYPIHCSVPLVLSQVCSTWRSLALAMPELWASFSLRIAQLPPPALGASLRHRILELHLDRSAAHPLSFDADFSKAEASPVGFYFLQTLVKHSVRWARVKLPLSPFFDTMYKELQGNLPNLESLELRVGESIGHSMSAEVTYFEDVPRLRRLALGASLPLQLPLPKNQLTELHLGASATMDMFQLLTRCPCPHLTTLILNPYYPLKVSTRSLPPFTQLKTLVLAIRDGYSRNPIIDVLDLLTAPALQTLEVISRREILIPRQAFTSFVDRSGCMPSSLSITFKDNLPAPSLINNLRTLSSLTHFSIFAIGREAMYAVSIILESLTPKSVGDDILLPNLVSFELQATAFHEALLDMVASRFNVTHPKFACLEYLGYCNSPVVEDHLRRLASLKNQGLRAVCVPRRKPPRSLFI